MKVQRIEILRASLPFRFAFRHSAAARTDSESIFVKLMLENGVVGWGEGLPRAYVTGEDTETAFDAIRDRLAPLIAGRDIADAGTVYNIASAIHGVLLDGEAAGRIYYGAARCALELALLNAASRSLGIPFTEWIGPLLRREARATAVIPSISSGSKLAALLCLVRCMGFRAVKVKVGGAQEQDDETLALARKILGPSIDLLADANGAWQAGEAIEKLNRWKPYNIRLVEQPVAARDFAGMRQVRLATGLDVMADESLRSVEDAERLIDAGACNVFNIRLSKCGGMIPAWRILKMAQAAGIACQLGCQVGESSVLAAAGAIFAMAAPGLLFFEGGYGRILLRQDIAWPRVSLGWGGIVRGGPGAGADERALAPFVAARACVPA